MPDDRTSNPWPQDTDSRLFETLAIRLRGGERDVANQLLASIAADEEQALDLIYREFLILQELEGPQDIDQFCSKFPAYQDRLRRLLQIDDAWGPDESLAEPHDSLAGLHFPLAGPGRDANGPGLEGSSASADMIGRQIDKYKVLQEIGEGGFGVVFMAEQLEPVRRKVALKVIKPGMDTRATIARFEAERQALALMDHPNICRVLDAGTTTCGHPFFVMDLIRGVPITDYCNQQNLPTADRLRLFKEVCRAVQHAHSKGIIHRDLKPSNVMVTLHDGEPVPKIIDFGISKALDRPLTEKTLFTRYGQILGTPMYMSPEQAEMSGLDIDTRSDIYSLGALLYELLAGTSLFQEERLKTANHADLVRIIQTEEPPTPSRRLSTLGVARARICDQRSASYPQLYKLLQGELDCIVMKAVEKDRRRRYETAADFARDLDRFLNDEPVSASAPTLRYRCLKFIRRNRSLVATTTAVVLALALGLALALFGLLHSEQQREIADRAREREASHRRKAEAAGGRAERARAAERAQRLEVEANLYAANIARAHSELLADNRRGCLEALMLCPPATREWEWNYLYRSAQNHLLAMAGHTEFAQCVRWSPDRQYVASSSSIWGDPRAGKVLLWNADTGEQLRTFATQKGGVRDIAFSPESRLLAAANSFDSGLTVWDVSTGETVISRKSKRIYTVDFNADGDLLAVGATDGTIQVLSAHDGRLLHELPRVGGAVFRVDFHPDGNTLASVNNDGKLCLWDALKGTLLDEAEHCGNRTVCFSPDGKLLATGGYHGMKSGRIKVYRMTDRNLSGYHDHITSFGAVLDLRFSPDAEFLAVSGTTPVLRLWHAATGEEYTHFFAHEGSANSVDFAPDGFRLVSCGMDQQVRFWSLRQASLAPLRRADRAYTRSLAFSADGLRLYLPADSATSVSRYHEPLEVWQQVANEGIWRRERSLEGFDQAMLAVAAHDRLDLVAVTGRRGDVIAWDAGTGRTAFRFQAHDGAATCIANCAGTGSFVTGGEDGYLGKWDWQSGEQLDRWLGHESGVRSLAAAADGRLASLGADGQLTMWDIRNGELLAAAAMIAAEDTDQAERVCVHPDGKTLAVGFESGRIELWSMVKSPRRSAAEVGETEADIADLHTDFPREHQLHRAGTLTGHSGKITGLSFHAGGTRLASSSSDQSVVVWNTGDSQKMLRLKPIGQNQSLLAVAFSPDGSHLAAARAMETTVWNGAEAAYPGKAAELNLDARSQLLWHEEMRNICRAAFNFYGVRFHCDRLLEQRPGHPDDLRRRMNSLAALGDWPAALRDARRLRELGQLNTAEIPALALLELRNRNVTEYHALARYAASEIPSRESAGEINSLAWTCVLGPGTLEDFSPVITAVASAAGRGPSPLRPYYLNTLAMLQLRAGRFEEAIETTWQSLALNRSLDTPADWLLLAWAHQELGHHAEAHHWFDKAAWSIEHQVAREDFQQVPWTQAAELLLLRAEVAEVLTRSRSGEPPEDNSPASEDTERKNSTGSSPVASWLALAPEQRGRVLRLRRKVQEFDDTVARAEEEDCLRSLIALQPHVPEHAIRLGWLLASIEDFRPPPQPIELYHQARRGFIADGSGLLLTGSGDHIRASVEFDAVAELTVEAWVHRDYQGPLASLGSSPQQIPAVWLSLPAESRSLYERMVGVTDSGRRYMLRSERLREPWNHVALSIDGRRATWWVNGKRQTSVRTADLSTLIGTVPLTIGTAGAVSRTSGTGLLRAVRVSDKARYQEEFAPATELSADEHTVLLYDFQDDAWLKTGQVRDTSSREHHGHLHDAWWLDSQQ